MWTVARRLRGRGHFFYLLALSVALTGCELALNASPSATSSSTPTAKAASALSGLSLVGQMAKIDIPIHHAEQVGLSIGYNTTLSFSADRSKWVFASADRGFAGMPSGIHRQIVLAERDGNGDVTYSVLSKGPSGGGAVYASYSILSPDGNWALFSAYDSPDLDATDTNSAYDFYQVNLLTGVMTRLPFFSGDMIYSYSPDGTKLLFASTKDHLDSNGGMYDLYTYEIANGNLALISSDDSGNAITGGSSARYLPDGNRIIFISMADVDDSAGAVVAGINDNNATGDVYLKNVATGDLMLISQTSANALSVVGFGSWDATVSADGKLVAFGSMSTDVVPGDTNSADDLFIRVLDNIPGANPPLVAGTTFRVQNGGTEPDGMTHAPVWSPTGHKLLFASTATNLGPADTNGERDLFVKDFDLGTIEMVNTHLGSQLTINDIHLFANFGRDENDVWFGASPWDAQNIVPITSGYTFLSKNLVSGVMAAEMAVTANGLNGGITYPEFSSDHSRLYFISAATNLIASDTNHSSDLFELNLTTKVVTRVLEQATIGSFCLVPGGSKVAFATQETGLVPGASVGSHIYIKDTGTGVVDLVSTDATSAVGSSSGENFRPFCSPDGKKVAFFTDADLLQGGDTNGTYDLYVKNIETGAIQRASEADGARATYFSRPLELSSGAKVYETEDLMWLDVNGLFRSDSNEILFMAQDNADFADSNKWNGTNFDDADSNGDYDVFIKNLTTGAVKRVNTDGTGDLLEESNNYGGYSSFEPGSGRRVVIHTELGLDANDTNGLMDYYVKDLDTGAVEWISGSATVTPNGQTNFGLSFGANFGQIVANVASNFMNLAFRSPSGTFTQLRAPNGQDFQQMWNQDWVMISKGSRAVDSDYAFIIAADADDPTSFSGSFYIYRVK